MLYFKGKAFTSFSARWRDASQVHDLEGAEAGDAEGCQEAKSGHCGALRLPHQQELPASQAEKDWSSHHAGIDSGQGLSEFYFQTLIVPSQEEDIKNVFTIFWEVKFT